MTPPRVMMVTGAYYPELSGAGLQCRQLIHALTGRMTFLVLTTAVDRSLPAEDVIEGVRVYRIAVDVRRLWSKVWAAVRLIRLLGRLRRGFDIVHLHGMSQKSWLVIAWARLFRKPIMVKLTSAGDDDPVSIRRKHPLAFRWYAKADRFIGVSHRLEELYRASGLSAGKFWLIPNGVDGERFRPRTPEERQALREELGVPPAAVMVLFVGFFSREKCPHVLFDAWTRLHHDGLPQTSLVFVGATRSPYYEVDPRLADEIREAATRLGLEGQVLFAGESRAVENYYAAADLFVLPSLREGLPNTLLEAMASGLCCIASRIPGITDTLIDHGVNGLLVRPGDALELAQAMRQALEQPASAHAWGRRARKTVEERWVIDRVAERYLAAYQGLAGSGDSRRKCAAS